MIAPVLIRTFNMEKLILDTKLAQYLISKSKKIILPGFDQVPLYDVIVFFFEQVKKVGLSDRASSISFNFLMAIPSGVIFLFTLIPYLPISTQITDELLLLTKSLAPNQNTYELVKNFLNDFLNTPRSGLLSVGFFLAIYYASNAIMGMMRSFNRSLVQVNQRKFFTDRWMAIRMTTVIWVEMGRYGIRVNRKITPDGIAIRKLKEMDDARSLKPTFFTCTKKKTITSYSGTWTKPGRMIFLLFEIRY